MGEVATVSISVFQVLLCCTFNLSLVSTNGKCEGFRLEGLSHLACGVKLTSFDFVSPDASEYLANMEPTATFYHNSHYMRPETLFRATPTAIAVKYSILDQNILHIIH